MTSGGADGSSAEEVPASASPIPVVISADGSAVINGVPVTGEAEVNDAILDSLHELARSRNASVTAAISDPSAELVVLVEVEPDGASRLLEQRQYEDAAPFGGLAEPARPSGDVDVDVDIDDDDTDFDFGAEYDDDDDGDDGDDWASELTPPPLVSSAPAAGSARDPQRPGRGKGVRQSDDEYKSPGFFRSPVGIGVAGGITAFLVVVPLIVLGSGSGSGGQDQTLNMGKNSTRPSAPRAPGRVTVAPVITNLPSVTESATAGPPLTGLVTTSPSATAKPRSTVGGGSSTATKGSGVVPRAAPKPKPKPHRQTAGEAVALLAASSPGRHICYRVYLDRDGWQKPACDGGTAGRVGGSQKIKSINMATAGTKGTAANAWVHVEQWKTPWSGAVDGVDNYIGSTKADYPYVLGFVTNVGDGAICQNAAVNGQWGGLACDQPTGQAPGNWIWGGTQDDSLWLQAVRFTV
ncbi:hypothetical protein [Streptomyces sp. NPDC088350]|uniref:hypothetical protein n=1 Tax=Streptomyces sp. NPDC088350 TaxID=3365854 RepID=UPI0038143CC0